MIVKWVYAHNPLALSDLTVSLCIDSLRCSKSSLFTFLYLRIVAIWVSGPHLQAFASPCAVYSLRLPQMRLPRLNLNHFRMVCTLVYFRYDAFSHHKRQQS